MTKLTEKQRNLATAAVLCGCSLAAVAWYVDIRVGSLQDIVAARKRAIEDAGGPYEFVKKHNHPRGFATIRERMHPNWFLLSPDKRTPPTDPFSGDG